MIMCLIDYCDERVLVLHERHHTAKIAHKCNECQRTINPGETYMVERYILDKETKTHKTCTHCELVRDWLKAECGGFVYAGIEEDICEHAGEGYGIAVKMMAVGIRRCWARKNGKLWPLPRMPKIS